jgi:hypothetical protein
MSVSCTDKDLVSRNTFWLLWGLPVAVVLLGAYLGPLARALIWPPAFLVMAAGCFVNAVRCGRLHCYLTGPLFLAAAGASVLVGLDVLALPWSWIGIGTLGGTVLACVPEWTRGRYVGRT